MHFAYMVASCAQRKEANMGVTVREKPRGSGVWWLFITHKGKRKAKTVGDKKTASTLAREVRASLAAGDLGLIFEENKMPLFKDYADQWLNGYARTYCKQSSWERHEGALRLYLLPLFGQRTIDQIYRKDIKAFIYSKLRDGLSASSVRNIKATLSGILSSAFEDELIAGNPASGLGKLIKSSDPKKHINPLTKAEVLKLLETAQAYCPRYYPVFLLAVSTGMRQGEIIGLQPGDIDFNGRFIEVRRSIVNGRMETPKNGKSRRVDMSLQLADVLKQHLTQTKEEALRKGWQQLPVALFYNVHGKTLDPDNMVKRYFHKCLERAGLRQVRFHDLRHTHASIHISQGESLAYVRDQLGHHSIQITVDIYGHLVPGSNRSAADRLLGETQSATQLQPEGSEAKEKAPRSDLSARINLARPRGFEPPTFGFVVCAWLKNER
jgi:integrase